jgi:hypothetical protein
MFRATHNFFADDFVIKVYTDRPEVPLLSLSRTLLMCGKCRYRQILAVV